MISEQKRGISRNSSPFHPSIKKEKGKTVATLLVLFLIVVLLVFLIPKYEKIGEFFLNILAPQKAKEEDDHTDHHHRQ
jgi:hypothetical protein